MVNGWAKGDKREAHDDEDDKEPLFPKPSSSISIKTTLAFEFDQPSTDRTTQKTQQPQMNA